MKDSDDELKQQVAGELREVRMRAREEAAPRDDIPPYPKSNEPRPHLESLPKPTSPEAPISPDRSFLNERWDVSTSLHAPPSGWLGRLISPLRKPLQRVLRFAMGQVVERQVEVNSAQVKFDNQVIEYIDERLERISTQYDHVLGLHGKRMEEIDERHLILQQELIQHVHDLIKRIDFVFETAEQNHLYLEASLREVRDEVRALATRLDPNASSGKENR